MSRSLGRELPTSLLALLDGQNIPAKIGLALLMTTVDARDYPHPALLSVGEVFSPSPTELRLALYSSSSTTKNLRRSGRFTLSLAHGGMGYYIKATARELPDALPGLAAFQAAVDEVLEDGEPIAHVTSGFTIQLTGDGSRTVNAWEQTVAALRTIS
jgi:hypothetical protein